MEPVNVSGMSQVLSLSVLTEDVACLIEVDRVDGPLLGTGLAEHEWRAVTGKG